jgi:predicted esterase
VFTRQRTCWIFAVCFSIIGLAGAAAAGSDPEKPNEPPVSAVDIPCNADPPDGAPQADPLPVYQEGTCPTIVPAPAENTIRSSGRDRKFWVAVPRNLSPDEKLPVIFLWHWLGGSPSSFYGRGEVQAAVDSQRFLAVIPAAGGDLIFRWPFNIFDAQARMEEEFRFFDNMLACVAQRFPRVNRNCVASVGVSAGAFFTDQLGHARANRLSSIISLSGGVGGLIREWGNPAHKLPALVLWGGPMNTCLGIFSIAATSQAMEDALVDRGNFFVECIHNCGHAEPPLDAPPGLSKYAALWQFVFDHPFWLGPGVSPYNETGLPDAFPTWCDIGQGSAVPRTGDCPGRPSC